MPQTGGRLGRPPRLGSSDVVDLPNLAGECDDVRGVSDQLERCGCGESADEDFNARVVLAPANEGQRRSLYWCRIDAVSERAGKYARFELERRFLVGRLPDGIADDRGWRISDRYIKNTHLRLRRMEPIHHGEIIFKLGQKHVPSPPDFSRMTITNIYLSPGEHAVLAGLEALELHKVRHSIEHDERIFSVDVFNDHLTGLVLAEVGFETPNEMDQTFDLPPWVIREVSGDIRFTGGALADLAAGQAAELIREITTPQP